MKKSSRVIINLDSVTVTMFQIKTVRRKRFFNRLASFAGLVNRIVIETGNKPQTGLNCKPICYAHRFDMLAVLNLNPL